MVFCALALVACALAAIGCASPGEPAERKPPVPQSVSDLAAEQAGNSVILTFTLPTETVDRRSLNQPVAIEIFRDFEPSAPASSPNSTTQSAPSHPTLHTTIPASVVDSYVAQGRIRYPDPLQPEDFIQHPDSVLVYLVRIRASPKKLSADSNAASLQVYPATDPITDLKAEVTHSGIQLTWTPPQRTPVGSAPAITGYRIFRSEAPPSPNSSTSVENTASPTETLPLGSQSKAPAPASPTNIADSQSPSYLDTQSELGNTYVYSVRSVLSYESHRIESADSNSATILARDITPPAAPAGLIPVYAPAQAGVPAHLELSWAISPETDLAGYDIYRSEQAGVLGTRLNSQLLLTPAFSDMNVVPGRSYFYSVTAVDRSGNASAPSAAVSSAVPAESSTP